MMRRATHEERMKLAEEICEEVKAALGDDLRAFLIFASVAKNADGPYSDVEMMAITTDRYEEYCSEFMRDGIRCEVDFTPISAAIKYAGEVDAEWPVAADQWHRFEPVYTREGDDCIDRIREAAQRSLGAEEKFIHEICMAMLVGYEEIATMMNARERDVPSDVATGLSNFALTVLRLVGFINRHFYQSMRNAWVESKSLSNLPADYARLIEIVHGEVETSPEVRYNAALELWANIKTWAAEQGIRWEQVDLILPKKKKK